MSAERPGPHRPDDPSPTTSTTSGVPGGAASGSHGDAYGPGMPRWVKLLALAAAVVLVLVLLLTVVLGGEHGPGRHF